MHHTSESLIKPNETDTSLSLKSLVTKLIQLRQSTGSLRLGLRLHWDWDWGYRELGKWRWVLWDWLSETAVALGLGLQRELGKWRIRQRRGWCHLLFNITAPAPAYHLLSIFNVTAPCLVISCVFLTLQLFVMSRVFDKDKGWCHPLVCLSGIFERQTCMEKYSQKSLKSSPHIQRTCWNLCACVRNVTKCSLK